MLTLNLCIRVTSHAFFLFFQMRNEISFYYKHQTVDIYIKLSVHFIIILVKLDFLDLSPDAIVVIFVETEWKKK